MNTIGGVYCENADVARLDNSKANDSQENIDGLNMMKDVMPFALEEIAARKLWLLSEQLSGVKFSI